MVFSCFSIAFPTNVLRMSSNTIQQGIFNSQTWSWKMGVPPGKKKLMWSTHSKIFRVLVLEKSINIGYFARGNLRSDQTNWVSSWGLGMPRNLNRSAINHINLKLQTYSFFFITDWCSLSMFQPVPACSSLFQLFKFQDEIPSISPIYGVALGELPDSLGQRRTFFWPNCVPLIGHIQSTAISENHHMGFGFLFHIWLFSKWWY